MADAGTAERRVCVLLERHPATRALARGPLVPVRGGLSNHAWRADTGHGSFFVRLGGPDAEALGVDRQSESLLLETTAAAGLSPRVIACSPDSGFLVTEFVAGDPWTRGDAHRLENVRRVARALRTLHALPVPDGLGAVSFPVRATRLEARLGRVGESPGELAGLARPALEWLGDRAAAARVPCHNDLHHLNLLDGDGRLWLVDWEYGGAGDPLLDLASFLCQHESTDVERDALLEAYGDSLATTAAVSAACLAFDYVQWLWYRLWVAGGRDSGGEYASRAAAVAARIRGACRTPVALQ